MRSRVPADRLIAWGSVPKRVSAPLIVSALGVRVSIESAPAGFQRSEETVSVLAKESDPLLRLTALVAPSAVAEPTLSVPSLIEVCPV